MIVFLDATGNKIINSQDEHIGRNSNDAAVFYIVVAAPISDAAQIYMTFTLPNGKTLFGNMARPEDPENLSDDDRRTASYLFSVEGTDYSVWRYRVPEKITSIQGTVQYTIVTITDSMTATASGSFTVSKGNRTAFPEDYVPTSMQDFVKEISGNLSDMKERLDANLYGKGGNAEAPIEGSPVYRIGELEKDKMDISSAKDIVYANDFEGKQTNIPVDTLSWSVNPPMEVGRIVRRGLDGQIYVPDPVDSEFHIGESKRYQAANKGYVDTKIEDIKETSKKAHLQYEKSIISLINNHDSLKISHEELEREVKQRLSASETDIFYLQQASLGIYYTFIIDDDVKYQKIVPNGAMAWARVENVPEFVSGSPVEIEVSSKNLLYKLVTEENIARSNITTCGVSVRINRDGGITLNGTATGSINIGLAGGGVHGQGEDDGGTPTRETYELDKNIYTWSIKDGQGKNVPTYGRIYLVVGNHEENPSSVTQSYGRGVVSFYHYGGGIGLCLAQISAGSIFNNETFYPQLEASHYVTPYARPQKKTYPYNADYINVVGGEIVTFKNDKKSKVPSRVTYQIRIGGTT